MSDPQIRRITRRWIVGAVTFLFCLASGAGAEAPNEAPIHVDPPALPASQAPIHPLSIVLQVVDQLGMSVTNRELTAIHNEDLFLGAALGLLRNEAGRHSEPAQYKADLLEFGLRVSQLHSAADAGNLAQSRAELARALQAFHKFEGHFDPSVLRAAQTNAHLYICPMHPDAVSARPTDLCPKCGMLLDQPRRVMPFAGMGGSNVAVRATIRTARALVVGQPVLTTLHLARPDGTPILPTDLVEAHTEKIHLLIIDPSLKDYHHVHPRPARAPGDYEFVLTPRKPGSYRAWADIRPRPMGLQEYAIADIQASSTAEELSDKSLVTNVVVDGLTFTLLLPDRPIRVGQPLAARLRITDAKGAGVTNLEPLMATFAHLVGFNEDFETVLHFHPKGAAVLDRRARGGPELEFQIYALKSGFVRLFAQVQIDGVQKFAPFGIEVKP